MEQIKWAQSIVTNYEKLFKATSASHVHILGGSSLLLYNLAKAILEDNKVKS